MVNNLDKNVKECSEEHSRLHCSSIEGKNNEYQKSTGDCSKKSSCRKWIRRCKRIVLVLIMLYAFAYAHRFWQLNVGGVTSSILAKDFHPEIWTLLPEDKWEWEPDECKELLPTEWRAKHFHSVVPDDEWKTEARVYLVDLNGDGLQEIFTTGGSEADGNRSFYVYIFEQTSIGKYRHCGVFYNTGGWTFIPTWRIWNRPLIWVDAEDANSIQSEIVHWKNGMYLAKDIEPQWHLPPSSDAKKMQTVLEPIDICFQWPRLLCALERAQGDSKVEKP